MGQFPAGGRFVEGGLFLPAFQKGDRICRSARPMPATGVTPVRGSIRPTLKVTWIEVRKTRPAVPTTVFSIPMGSR